MIELHRMNRRPSTPFRLEWTATPSETALIVVDLQNDYCSPLGAYGRSGADLSMMPPVIECARGLIGAARETGVLVVWLQQTTLHGGVSAAPASLRARDRYLAAERCLDGTFGHAYVGPLAARRDEPVVRKLRSSGFVGTMLDQILDANGIRTCVLIGVGTEGCVEATVRSAVDFHYRPVVVEDGVASLRMDLHVHSLHNMRGFAAVVSSGSIAARWRAAPFDGGMRPGRAARVHADLEGLAHPGHTALLLVEEVDRLPHAAVSLRRAARAAGALVVHLRPASGARRRETAGPGQCALSPPGMDGFEGSPLHSVLERRGIHTVVVAGAEAHRCVESTARGATHRNYAVVCVEDGIADRDAARLEGALAIMRQRYDVTTAARLRSLWAAAGLRAHETPTGAAGPRR